MTRVIPVAPAQAGPILQIPCSCKLFNAMRVPHDGGNNVRSFILLLLLMFTCHVSLAEPQISQETVKAFFDGAFHVQKQDHDLAGVTVSVVYENQVLFKAGYGYADIEAGTPVDPDKTLFRIASISKPFVWTAIMQLHEQGKLDLDDDVNQYLNGWQIPATYDEPVRIWHLLTHTPGLEDHAIGMNARDLDEVMPLADYLQDNVPRRVRPPGTFASYSNWSTSLAGHIIEQVTEQTWSDYVDQHILQPLAMHATNAHQPMADELMANHAKSYRHGNGELEVQGFQYLNDSPAGVMSTTADDMTRFMIAHLNDGEWNGHRILQPDTARRMQSPLFEVHDRIPPMLHGFYRADLNDQVIYGHGGDTNQFHSQLALFPQHGLGIFVSFNSDPGAAARSNLIPAFVDHFFPKPHLLPPPDVVDIDLADYTGEYLPLRRNHSNIMKLSNLVTVSNISAGQARLLWAGSAWMPVAPDMFRARYSEQYLVFTRDEQGVVTHVVAGSPLGTLNRVSGLDAPSNQQLIIGLIIVIALAAALGYAYAGVFLRHLPNRLPNAHVLIAWVHAVALLALY
ncbi:MAG: serine hydrolase domain-containing protein, partial [Pseudomonadota bacterium]